MLLIALLETIALTGGTVHTMIAGETPRVMTVLIEEDRIKAIGTDVAVPSDAKKIDCTGLHLVPGLIDGLVNHDSDHDRLYISSGVTLVRDVGNDLQRILLEREHDARNRGPGPALWISGSILDGVPPSTTSAAVLATPEEASEKLPRFFAEVEPDFISMFAGLSKPTWHKVLELTHKQNLRAWGPLLRGADLRETMQAGQDGLFYLEAFLPPGVTWDKLEPGSWKDSVEALAASKLAFTPALDIFAQRLIAPRDDRPPELAFLGPFYIVAWMADLEVRRSFSGDSNYLKAGLKVVETQGKLLKDLYEHGVTLVPGSASPNPWLFPGKALVDELGLWERAGIPSAAVLRMATAGAAQAIGADKDRGTLAAGKIADVVIVKKDPEADVDNLRDPAIVVLRGRVLDRATLESLRVDLRDRQQKLQAAAFKPLSIKDPELPFGDVLLRGKVETRAFGQRVSGESFAVVRRPDASLAYCGHMLTPGSATTADTDVEIAQTIRDGEVAEFSVKITTGPHHVVVTGTLAGGSLNVERRLDDTFLDNTPRRERLAFVDVGSVTTELILGQRRATGRFRAMYFEDIDPVIGNYEMHVDKEGTHLLKTPTGAMTVKYDALGAPTESLRQQGKGRLETRLISSQAGQGTAGLPVPREKPLVNDAAAQPVAPGPTSPSKPK
jgi:hypothetical protein